MTTEKMPNMVCVDKEEAIEGKDAAGNPRMEYLVQITGGGKFSNAEDVKDVVADIVSFPPPPHYADVLLETFLQLTCF